MINELTTILSRKDIINCNYNIEFTVPSASGFYIKIYGRNVVASLRVF